MFNSVTIKRDLKPIAKLSFHISVRTSVLQLLLPFHSTQCSLGSSAGRKKIYCSPAPATFFRLLDPTAVGYIGSAPLYIFETKLLESVELPFVDCIAVYIIMQDYLTVQRNHFEYLNMMPVIKLPVNSHVLISLYQLYSQTCWIAVKHYHNYTNSYYMLTHVADLRIMYLCLTSPLDNGGQADRLTSLICIEGLLDKPSRYLQFDRRHEGSVPVFRIGNR